MSRPLVTFFAFCAIFAMYTSNSYGKIHIPSQNNGLIAFSSDATANNKQQIFIMSTDGSGVQQVCNLDLNCYNPRFSPDGRKIVFSATNVMSDFIYMINLDDTGTFSFPVFIDGGSDPEFSPDGSYLLYRSEKNDNNAVYIMDLKTDSSDIINDGSLSTHAKFSPDGRKVVYSSSASGNFDLVVLDLDDTSDNAQKTIADSPDAELYGIFSPDGKLIAYSSFDINYKGTVHICNADGKDNISVSKGMNSSYNPKFSPDGTRLAFISDKTGNFEIYTCDLDGSNIKRVTDKKGSTMDYDWSPDSKSIAYENIVETVSNISIVNLETGSSVDITGDKAYNVNPSFQK